MGVCVIYLFSLIKNKIGTMYNYLHPISIFIFYLSMRLIVTVHTCTQRLHIKVCWLCISQLHVVNWYMYEDTCTESHINLLHIFIFVNALTDVVYSTRYLFHLHLFSIFFTWNLHFQTDKTENQCPLNRPLGKAVHWVMPTQPLTEITM